MDDSHLLHDPALRAERAERAERAVLCVRACVRACVHACIGMLSTTQLSSTIFSFPAKKYIFEQKQEIHIYFAKAKVLFILLL